MVTRRQLLQTTALFTGGIVMGCNQSGANDTGWTMPEEAMAHRRTWMAFSHSESI